MIIKAFVLQKELPGLFVGNVFNPETLKGITVYKRIAIGKETGIYMFDELFLLKYKEWFKEINYDNEKMPEFKPV